MTLCRVCLEKHGRHMWYGACLCNEDSEALSPSAFHQWMTTKLPESSRAIKVTPKPVVAEASTKNKHTKKTH